MFKRLPGFRDFYPEECQTRNHILFVWRSVPALFGFQEYDTPLLEPLELFTTKSGEEIASQLFNFEDRSKRKVALRPEITPSLARMVGARANSMPKPIKWFNIGEHFRYERPQKGRLRSFYQLNCDIFGEEEPSADAEAIALLVQTLTTFSLTKDDFYIRLSDRNLWVHFIQSWGIEDNQIEQVLSIIDKIEREKPEKILEHLTPIFKENTEAFREGANKLLAIRSLPDLEAFVKEQKFADKLDQCRENWVNLVQNYEALGIGGFVQIDLSIVRGLAYYTGFVFEAFQKVGQARSLAGGGRYDHLVKRLGGPDIPAVGFAIGDVTLANFLETKDLIPQYSTSPDFFAVIFHEENECKTAALQQVTKIREQHYSIEYALKPTSIPKQFKQANQLDARFALIYGLDEIKENCVTIKDLSTRKEKTVKQEEIVDMNLLNSLLQEGL